MKKKLLMQLTFALLALASAQAMAFVVVDSDGQYWDCHYTRGDVLVCVPLDYMPPLDP